MGDIAQHGAFWSKGVDGMDDRNKRRGRFKFYKIGKHEEFATNRTGVIAYIFENRLSALKGDDIMGIPNSFGTGDCFLLCHIRFAEKVRHYVKYRSIRSAFLGLGGMGESFGDGVDGCIRHGDDDPVYTVERS